mmetsp:Transcript_15176/g.28707  ORF Transcript_15176/g.28707 Transcript_15176/m.28707 type:complete len:111 (+) Transcript_15176:241-573(+)
MQLKNFSLIESNFSENSNVNFGIKDHLNLGLRYEQTIGIFGFQFCVTLHKKGMRIRFRKKMQRKINKKYRITKEQSMKWYLVILFLGLKNFSVNVSKFIYKSSHYYHYSH